jgi:hypothetical protein
MKTSPSKRESKRSLWLYFSIAFGLSFFVVDYLYWVTWGLWSLSVLTQQMDACFYGNPILVSLFTALEKRDLSNAKRVAATMPAVLQADEYSIEALEKASEGWTQPVIVRGMFANASALTKWAEPTYLADTVFVNTSVSVIHNGTISKHYEMVCAPKDKKREADETFSEYKPFNEVVQRIANGSPETIVFPPASRSKRVRDRGVEERWNAAISKDLDLKRIGPMFEAEAKATVLTQMFVGGGRDTINDDPENSEVDNLGKALGTGWHGDVCNNFVVLIAGVKHWIMMDPKYSTYMRPSMRNGKTAVVGAHLSMEKETMPYLPHLEFDLYPGDMLYNPEWYWHSIHNHPVAPFAMGLISRQCHVGRNLKMATAYTSAVIVNHLTAAIFDVEARMRVWALISGSSLMKPEEGVNVDNAKEIKVGYV